MPSLGDAPKNQRYSSFLSIDLQGKYLWTAYACMTDHHMVWRYRRTPDKYCNQTAVEYGLGFLLLEPLKYSFLYDENRVISAVMAQRADVGILRAAM